MFNNKRGINNYNQLRNPITRNKKIMKLEKEKEMFFYVLLKLKAIGDCRVGVHLDD